MATFREPYIRALSVDSLNGRSTDGKGKPRIEKK